MKASFLLTFLILFTGCSIKSKPQHETFYVIKKEQGKDSKVNTIRSFYYGHHNFILSDTSTVFYYSTKPIYFTDGHGIDRSRPKKLNLYPDSLINININELQQFLSSNVQDSMIQENHVKASISSPTDSIKSRAFKIITEHFMSTGLTRFAIRLWTEEEKYVTEAKIANLHYEPDSIDWEVGFGGIKFSPPIKE